MKKSFVRFLSLLISSGLLFLQIQAPVFATFADVPADYQYKTDIEYLEQHGVVNEDTFRPAETITKGLFAKWLLKNTGFADEQYKPETRLRFFDVKSKNPYAPYIYKLADLGVIKLEKGKKNKFFPENKISRADAISWLFKVEGIPTPLITNSAQLLTTDLGERNRLAPLFNKAITFGLLSPGKVMPVRKVTRGEAAHYLAKAKDTAGALTVTIMPSTETDMMKNPKFDVMNGAWERIFSKYLKRDSLDKNDMIYGAIEGMVKELGDKHSDFERPGDNALLESLSGEIEGIGAVIQMKDEEVVVVSPIKNSPADKAGLLPNDIITKVDDIDVKGMKLSEVVAKIKGKKGTQVKLSIKRDTKTLTFNITRDVVKIVSADVEWTTDNIAEISLSNFGETTDMEFKKIIEQIKERQTKGIIIDLRNNPGGYLTTALQIAGHFVKQGDKIASVRYPNREEPEYSSGTGELAELKTVVIVNKGSASASEILAGALQDYGLAKVVGEQSYGKGTVQEISDFTDGSTLKLTVAEWLTPNGRSIEKNGITPDIEVKITDADREANRDPQMDAAVAELRK